MNQNPSIGNAGTTPLPLDIPRLLATRMLLQADSGGGKSWALKRILEQTHGHVQQIVLDPEGEFSTLREKFDYLLCAPEGADAIANPKTAAILARKLRETRVSAVIDIFDLRMQEQKHFVRLFIEELLASPKSLWNPCLLIIDEAQIFAPEKDQAESLSAIMDLRGRGRKRGLCPILATPRLGQLSKDAAAGMQNKLIGVTTLDVDVSRAARDLSMLPKDATTMLRNLDPGEFFCFGPALTRTITKIKIGTIKTSHGQHTVGKDTRPPAPSEKIKSVIAKLTDLPKEAEQEARTLADFKTENAQLKRELTISKKAQPSTAPTQIITIEKPVVGKRAAEGLLKACKELKKISAKTLGIHQASCDAMGMITREADDIIAKLDKVKNANEAGHATTIAPGTAHSRPLSAPANRPAPPPAGRPATSSVPPNGGNDGQEPPTKVQIKIISAIAELRELGVEPAPRNQVMLLSGYSHPSSTGFAKALSGLKTAGHIIYPQSSTVALTSAGLSWHRPTSPPETVDELHRRILGLFGNAAQKVLQPLIEKYPDPMTRVALMEAAGYNHQASTGFAKSLGRFRSLGLIEYPTSGEVRATELLFPPGLAR